MTFTYTKTTNVYYNERSDEWDTETKDFDYSVDFDDIERALTDIIYDKYFSNIDFDKQFDIKHAISEMILDIDDITDLFYTELYEYFKEEALENEED